ncbi:uncharacterized protein C2orf80 homolog [Bufo gargarizans]|uniref:uncharacterized protein C2orf80 homolog n=1 Tax=Bufo gargarizans TaxID=30331 RepID=UPI001CF356CC|nr:uncharacterized protein C2orf80 homolog [Bufo gargarizans]
MERKLLRREIEKLLGDYVSTTLREKEFDPKGRRESSSLDDLAHYDLAIGVALNWLSSSKGNESLKKERLKLTLNQHKYPNRMEREAMILSSFAGMLMNSFPVEEVFEIYGNKPSTRLQNSAKVNVWLKPFNISLHPFAMLTAPQAAKHALQHCARLWNSSDRNQTTSTQDQELDSVEHVGQEQEEISTEPESEDNTDKTEDL